MMRRYKSIKDEYSKTKIKFVKNKDEYTRLKQTNLNLKKLICQMMSKNPDVKNYN